LGDKYHKEKHSSFIDAKEEIGLQINAEENSVH
jgi:hypothetical protein